MPVCNRPYPFHKWFAWHPIRTIDGRLTWLANVWRRRVFCSSDQHDSQAWEYVRLDGYQFETDTPHAIAR